MSPKLDKQSMDMKKTTAELRKATDELRRKVSDPTQLYAVAGVGDYAVEKLREVPARVAKLRGDKAPAPGTPDRTLQEKVQEAVLSIPAEALQLTAKISTFAEDGVKKAEAQYKDLAHRGESIVKRIGNQKATQDLLNQAQATVTRARVARGAATRGAENTKVATKGTVTSAKKTATKAGKAATAAATKIGD